MHAGGSDISDESTVDTMARLGLRSYSDVVDAGSDVCNTAASDACRRQRGGK